MPATRQAAAPPAGALSGERPGQGRTAGRGRVERPGSSGCRRRGRRRGAGFAAGAQGAHGHARGRRRCAVAAGRACRQAGAEGDCLRVCTAPPAMAGTSSAQSRACKLVLTLRRPTRPNLPRSRNMRLQEAALKQAVPAAQVDGKGNGRSLGRRRRARREEPESARRRGADGVHGVAGAGGAALAGALSCAAPWPRRCARREYGGRATPGRQCCAALCTLVRTQRGPRGPRLRAAVPRSLSQVGRLADGCGARCAGAAVARGGAGALAQEVRPRLPASLPSATLGGHVSLQPMPGALRACMSIGDSSAPCCAPCCAAATREHFPGPAGAGAGRLGAAGSARGERQCGGRAREHYGDERCGRRCPCV